PRIYAENTRGPAALRLHIDSDCELGRRGGQFVWAWIARITRASGLLDAVAQAQVLGEALQAPRISAGGEERIALLHREHQLLSLDLEAGLRQQAGRTGGECIGEPQRKAYQAHALDACVIQQRVGLFDD